MKIETYLEAKRQLVDRYLESAISQGTTANRLAEAMRYSLMAGGKRIRPILALASAEVVGGPMTEELALPVGAALEMIHTYSLIHDDLPAMDNDDLRRGRPTNHKVFGEALAILSGDALLTEAFHLLSGIPSAPPKNLLAIVQEIAWAAGLDGMAGGQAIDLESEGKKIGSDRLEILHRMKTGCLIRASVVSGGLVGGAKDRPLEALRQYGEAVGLAFQIADDILDVEGETAVLGKTARSDAGHGKATYPALLGLETSKKLAQQWAERAIAALSPLGSGAGTLSEIAQYIVSRPS